MAATDHRAAHLKHGVGQCGAGTSNHKDEEGNYDEIRRHMESPKWFISG